MAATKHAPAEATRRLDLAISAFTESLRTDAHEQLDYDYNPANQAAPAPAGRIENSLQCGLVSALTARVKWEPDLVVALAADLLEDANLHDLAAELRGEDLAQVDASVAAPRRITP